jgi:hypothetical protein
VSRKSKHERRETTPCAAARDWISAFLNARYLSMASASAQISQKFIPSHQLSVPKMPQNVPVCPVLEVFFLPFCVFALPGGALIFLDLARLVMEHSQPESLILQLQLPAPGTICDVA